MLLTETTILALLATHALSSPVSSPLWPKPRRSASAPKGKKIFWVGHSFHWFLPQPVALLAKEAGIEGHQDVGIDRIGASLPCQHWDRADASGTNVVKEALKAGKADVLTLATREQNPDQCIPKFAKLAVSKQACALRDRGSRGRRLSDAV